MPLEEVTHDIPERTAAASKVPRTGVVSWQLLWPSLPPITAAVGVAGPGWKCCDGPVRLLMGNAGNLPMSSNLPPI